VCGRVLAGGRGVLPDAVRVGGRVAAVQRLPGPVAFLGNHADRRLRRLRPDPAGHLAGIRVAVGLPGPPPCHRRGPGGRRGRVRAVPRGARCGAAVRGPGAAGRRRRRRDKRGQRGADRPAARAQRARAGGHQRRRPPGPGRRRAGHQRAGPVRAGAHSSGLVAAPGRLRRRCRGRAGDPGDRAGANGCPGRAAAAGGRAAAGTRDARGGPAVHDRGARGQRLLPVPGPVAGRAGASLAGPFAWPCWPAAWPCSPAP
jgi:hypothetical protein